MNSRLVLIHFAELFLFTYLRNLTHLFHCSSRGGVDEDEGGGPQLDHHQHHQEQFLYEVEVDDDISLVLIQTNGSCLCDHGDFFFGIQSCKNLNW